MTHPPRPPARPERPSWRATLAKFTLSLSILLVGGELLCRTYWAATKGSPLLSPDVGWLAYYPKLRTSGALNGSIGNADEPFDVLILGGSTISDEFGDVGPLLAQGLERRLGRPVRVYNVATFAHNSRDSAVKRRLLAHQRFDLVVAYDGINDARMNNASADRFRDDYSHCRWYATLSTMERRPLLARSGLAFTAAFLLDRAAEESGLVWFIPRHRPTAELMGHGRHLRSRVAFRSNYEQIVAAADARGERVVLMTFAYHVPDDYTEEACAAGRLDYANARPSPVEEWGHPAHVTAAIEQHNDAIRELAADHPEVILVDQQKLLPRDGKTFTDCCHLTREGCVRFVDNVLAALDAAD